MNLCRCHVLFHTCSYVAFSDCMSLFLCLFRIPSCICMFCCLHEFLPSSFEIGENILGKMCEIKCRSILHNKALCGPFLSHKNSENFTHMSQFPLPRSPHVCSCLYQTDSMSPCSDWLKILPNHCNAILPPDGVTDSSQLTS